MVLNSSRFAFSASFVLLFAFITKFFLDYAGDVPINGPNPDTEPWDNSAESLSTSPPSVVTLGDETYDIKKVSTPVASGFVLRVLEFFLCRIPLGPLIRRGLFNSNGAHTLRELAHQVPEGILSLHRPLRRLSSTALQRHEEAERAMPMETVNRVPGTLTSGWEGGKEKPFWEVYDFHEAYSSGRLTPSQAMQRVFEALRHTAHLRAFVAVNETDVKAQARASDARWNAGAPLSVWDGVPIAVKDMIDVKGYVKGYGTKTERKAKEEDDIMVRHFRELGAIVLGTTAMAEFGVTPLGYSALHKGPFNAYDESRFSGGSSSGSAVAVVSGVVPVAIGFDGGGSVRIPCAMSGCVGLMTSFQRIPVDDHAVKNSAVVHGGPMTGTVRDAALAYAVLARREEGHIFESEFGGEGMPVAHLDKYGKIEDLRGIRIGVFREHYEDAPPELVEAADKGLKALTDRGAQVVDIKIPNLQVLSFAHAFSISVEFASGEDWRYHNKGALESNTRISLGLGRIVTGLEYAAAMRVKAWAFQWMNKLFEEQRLDAIASPTVGALTGVISKDTKETGESNTALVVQMMKFIFLANLLGNPGISVPVGYTGLGGEGGGMPMGFHLMGDHWSEATLLRLANAVETELGREAKKRPPRENFFDLRLDES